jgi:hypothetical protein
LITTLYSFTLLEKKIAKRCWLKLNLYKHIKKKLVFCFGKCYIMPHWSKEIKNRKHLLKR